MKALQRGSTIAATVLTSCLTGGTVAAAEQYSQAKAEQYIKAAEAARAESVSTNDASVVSRILADDCVWLLDGKVFDKTHAIADAAKGPGDFLSNHLEYAHVKFFGDTAVVQGSEMWTQKGGKKGRFVWLDTWVRRNGQWQIVGR
jgi:ketosteroid isomerase-like protein